ncbi:GvpL/GvpF family gas vesicle protein [Diaminobutyricibacter sp. McL0618]|uniref:GvpL/GvpF family gas vesicle protein n=1 Tax=Leifsonia sp. McL0618 TaxID=3415677 RepID=UPI003CEE42EA
MSALDTDQYVYGIVRAGTPAPGLPGVGDERVEVLASGDLAVLVTPVVDSAEIGTPENLLAHSRVLDDVAAESAVLPMTFGTIVPDTDAIMHDVLPRMRDEYLDKLRRIEGASQFTVRARYVEEVALAEVISENPEVARLRKTTSGRSEEESYYELIEEGRLVADELEHKASGDARTISDRLAPVTRELVIHERSRAGDVVELVALVERTAQGDFESAVERLAAESAGRITFRLLGPQAPYDFVGEV